MSEISKSHSQKAPATVPSFEQCLSTIARQLKSLLDTITETWSSHLPPDRVAEKLTDLQKRTQTATRRITMSTQEDLRSTIEQYMSLLGYQWVDDTRADMNKNKRPPKHVIAEIAKYIDELQIQIRDQANEADAEEAEVKVSEAALAIGSDLEGWEDKMMDDVAAQLQLHDQTDILGEAQSDAIKLVAQVNKADQDNVLAEMALEANQRVIDVLVQSICALETAKDRDVALHGIRELVQRMIRSQSKLKRLCLGQAAARAEKDVYHQQHYEAVCAFLHLLGFESVEKHVLRRREHLSQAMLECFLERIDQTYKTEMKRKSTKLVRLQNMIDVLVQSICALETAKDRDVALHNIQGLVQRMIESESKVKRFGLRQAAVRAEKDVYHQQHYEAVHAFLHLLGFESVEKHVLRCSEHLSQAMLKDVLERIDQTHKTEMKRKSENK